MAQVSQVTDHQIIHVNDIDGIAPKLLPMLIVMIRGHTSNQYVTYLILPRTPHDTWVATNASNIVMTGMIVADCDNSGVELAQPEGVTLLRRERVCDQGHMFATQLKAGVALPGNFHRFMRFSHTSSGGDLSVSSPELYCTTRIDVLQVR